MLLHIGTREKVEGLVPKEDSEVGIIASKLRLCKWNYKEAVYVREYHL
jgi:hypothetical protein